MVAKFVLYCVKMANYIKVANMSGFAYIYILNDSRNPILE